jgi:hypothetical protein
MTHDPVGRPYAAADFYGPSPNGLTQRGLQRQAWLARLFGFPNVELARRRLVARFVNATILPVPRPDVPDGIGGNNDLGVRKEVANVAEKVEVSQNGLAQSDGHAARSEHFDDTGTGGHVGKLFGRFPRGRTKYGCLLRSVRRALRPVTGVAPTALLDAAAAAELRSEHPLGKTIVEYARASTRAIAEPERFGYRPGRGIDATVSRERVLVGNLALMPAVRFGSSHSCTRWQCTGRLLAVLQIRGRYEDSSLTQMLTTVPQLLSNFGLALRCELREKHRAREHSETALALTRSPAERRFIERRVQACAGSPRTK